MKAMKDFFVRFILKKYKIQKKILCCTQNNTNTKDIKLDNENIIISSNINDSKKMYKKEEKNEENDKNVEINNNNKNENINKQNNDKKIGNNKKMLFKRTTTFVN